MPKSDVEGKEDENSNNLSCKECGKSYRKQEQLKNHLSFGHTQKQYTYYICEICNAVSASEASLKAHKRTNHTEKSSEIYCEICKKVFHRKHISRHMKNAHKIVKPKEIPKYECTICKQTFFLKEKFDRHNWKFHLKKQTTDCQICQIHCMTRKNLEGHMQKCHSDYLTSQNSEHTNFNCETCQKTFQTFEMLQTHLANSHTSKMDDESPLENELIHCGKCNMNFKSEVDMTQHLTEQRVVTVIQCKFCLETFHHKCHFYTHHQKYHYQKWPRLKCTLCDTSVTDYVLLNSHELNCHPEVQQNRSASFSGDLNTSTEEGDFVTNNDPKIVNECIENNDVEQVEVENCNLIRAEIIKIETDNNIENNDVEQVEVENCNLIQAEMIKIETDNNIEHIMFDESSNHSDANPDMLETQINQDDNKNSTDGRTTLMNHQKVYSFIKDSKSSKEEEQNRDSKDLSCKECGKMYQTAQSLKYHLSSVHNQKQRTFGKFICEICNAVSASAASLKAHVKYIHVDANYICEICGTGYKWESYLNRHRKEAHQIEQAENPDYEYHNCNRTLKLPKNVGEHHCIENTEKSTFVCGFCQKQCLDPQSLKCHMKESHLQGNHQKCKNRIVMKLCTRDA